MKITNSKDLFGLLRSKDVLAILDGDKLFDDYMFEDGTKEAIRMPYLSGPTLCSISTTFGYPMSYAVKGGNLSRWQYLDNLLEYCISKDKASDLLAFLFSKEQFADILSSHNRMEIEKAHTYFVQTIIQKINSILYFGGNELIVCGNQFGIRPIGSNIEIAAPKIKTIDREYVKSISNRAMQDVEQGNFDSAITKSRTLLEETFCYVVEKKGEQPITTGDIGALFKQVKSLYNMHTDSNTDKRINMLLTGLNSIVSSIAEMRNKDSDAHGVGAARINIEEHHARLFVNSAMMMADFILSVYNKNSGISK